MASDPLAESSSPHANTDTDANAAAVEVGHGCACCVFCAPALPGAWAALPGPPLADSRAPMSDAGPTPDGLRDRLLRPPRG
jgi:hypothetical protein